MSSRAWRAERVQASFLANEGRTTDVLEKIGFEVKAFKMDFRLSNFSLPHRKRVNGPSTGSLGMLRSRGNAMASSTWRCYWNMLVRTSSFVGIERL